MAVFNPGKVGSFFEQSKVARENKGTPPSIHQVRAFKMAGNKGAFFAHALVARDISIPEKGDLVSGIVRVPESSLKGVGRGRVGRDSALFIELNMDGYELANGIYTLINPVLKIVYNIAPYGEPGMADPATDLAIRASEKEVNVIREENPNQLRHAYIKEQGLLGVVIGNGTGAAAGDYKYSIFAYPLMEIKGEASTAYILVDRK